MQALSPTQLFPRETADHIAHLEYKVLCHRSDGPEPHPGQFMAAYEELQSLYAGLPQDEEIDLPFTDDLSEERAPFAVAIEGRRLAPTLSYDDAGTWCNILSAHFPNSEVGIVLV